MTSIGVLTIGAGIILMFAAYLDVSPVKLVRDALTGAP